jgi:hypothetical protein
MWLAFPMAPTMCRDVSELGLSPERTSCFWRIDTRPAASYLCSQVLTKSPYGKDMRIRFKGLKA